MGDEGPRGCVYALLGLGVIWAIAYALVEFGGPPMHDATGLGRDTDAWSRDAHECFERAERVVEPLRDGSAQGERDALRWRTIQVSNCMDEKGWEPREE
jgi:hypothetical protein